MGYTYCEETRNASALGCARKCVFNSRRTSERLDLCKRKARTFSHRDQQHFAQLFVVLVLWEIELIEAEKGARVCVMSHVRSRISSPCVRAR